MNISLSLSPGSVIYQALGGAVTTDFVMTVTTAGGGETFTIPCRDIGVFDAVIDWGDGTAPTPITSWNDANLAHAYAGAAGDYQIAISGTFTNIYFNNGGDRLMVKSVDNLGVVGWLTMESAFYGCSNIESFVVGNTNTSLVANFANMLRNLTNLVTPPNLLGLDTSSATSMSSMMRDLRSITMPPPLSHLVTSSVTNMVNMMRDWFAVGAPPDIDGFNVEALTTGTSFALNLPEFDSAWYDDVLVKWGAQNVQNGVSISFGNSVTTPGPAGDAARAARYHLRDVHGWTITDGDPVDVPASITGTPSITGTAQEGETLTLAGAASSGTPTPTDQYALIHSVNGTVQTSLDPYVIPASDVGGTYTLQQTSSNGAGGPAVATSAATDTVIAAGAFTPTPVPATTVIFDADVATFTDATGWDTDPAQTIDTSGIGRSIWDGTQGNTNIFQSPATLVSGRNYAAMLSAKTTNGLTYFRVAGDGFIQGDSMGINNTAFFPFLAAGNYTNVGFRVNGSFNGEIDTVQFYDMQPMIDKPKDIYICAGQSNEAAGSAKTGFDAFTTPIEPRAMFVSPFERTNQGARTDGSGAAINAAWDANYGIGIPRLCAEPLPQASVCFEAIGPVTSRATVICDSGTEDGRQPLFVGVAHGGTSLDTEWNKDDDARCYDLMVANVQAMLDENPGNRIAGMFWCQGESTPAAGYAAKFKAFINDLRSKPGWGEFPVVISEIGEDDTDPTVAAKILEQQKCATGSGDASELTKCAYVPRPAGWALELDGIHYTGTTNIARGTASAQAMISLFSGTPVAGEYMADGYVNSGYVEG